MTIFDTNVDIFIEAAFGYDPYDASPVWTEITTYVDEGEIERGRVTPTTPFASGTATLVLDNTDGRFDPINTSSPYSPNVDVAVPVRIRTVHNSITYDVWRGFVSSWDIEYPSALESAVAVPMFDALRLFNQADLSGNTYSQEATHVRIGNVLDDIGWPSAWRSLEAGVVQVAAFEAPAETSALGHLQDVAAAEVGHLFIAADGNVTFHNRVHHSGGATSKGTFGPSNLVYDDVRRRHDDEELWTEARVSRIGGVEQVASDAAAVVSYRERSLPLSGQAMSNDNEAMSVAEWIVARHKDTTNRIGEVFVLPQFDPLNVWPVVLDVDLRDSITVIVDPPGGGTDLNQQLSVEKIIHRFRHGLWETTYSCFPLAAVETADYWILGTSELGTETRLA